MTVEYTIEATMVTGPPWRPYPTAAAERYLGEALTAVDDGGDLHFQVGSEAGAAMLFRRIDGEWEVRHA